MRAFQCDADGFRRVAAGVWDQARAWGQDLGFALSFLTRAPIPAAWGRVDAPVRALRAFPLIGAALGLAGGLLYLGLLRLGAPALAAAGATLLALALFGGVLHEDGLADCADAFAAAGADAARRLEILKDPRVGSAGALVLAASFLIRAACLADLGGIHAVLALLGAEGASRAIPALLLWTLPPARPDGLAAALGEIPRGVVLAALALALALLWGCFGLRLGLVAFSWAALAFILVRWTARRRLGGVVGDVLGLGQQAAATAILFAVAAKW